MHNNFTNQDFVKVRELLKKKNIILTQSSQVEKFEKSWSKWLGVKYSTFVNSGSSANFITISILKILNKNPSRNEIIVPTLTWVSDLNSVIMNGFKPVFVDINLSNLSMDINQVLKKINKKTLAVFITHAQGFNGLNDNLLNQLKKKKIHLIEDVCESYGAKFKKKKLGNFGLISNFSFYYAHHMTTIEGGMICTNSKELDTLAKMKRGHGLLRDSQNESLIKNTKKKFRDLNSDFIFFTEGFNLRNNELSAVIGIEQLKRLTKNIKLRNDNHKLFLKNLRKDIFFTNFKLEGSSNYGFNLILKQKDKKLFKKVISLLNSNLIEHRTGSVGGGNQLRQPYLKSFNFKNRFKSLRNTEHMHFYSLYIGNYPKLNKNKIVSLCRLLDKIKK